MKLCQYIIIRGNKCYINIGRLKLYQKLMTKVRITKGTVTNLRTDEQYSSLAYLYELCLLSQIVKRNTIFL